MLNLYRFCMQAAEPALAALLDRRAARGKEIPERLGERQGLPGRPRPLGPMVWIHAASVGEAQSALILVEALLKQDPALSVLMTTGTTSSARMMEGKLPERAFHQFFPLDHPGWVARFLDHWTPNLALWMESELWPNMLAEIRRRNIPAALVNARLSEKSFRRWRLAGTMARGLFRGFSLILTQTQKDADHFAALGAENIVVTDNLKFSARTLPADDAALKMLASHTINRPLWLYASTHKGEEAMACRIHQVLKSALPDILTVIVPRHPDRRADIRALCEQLGLSVVLRGPAHMLPLPETDIYIADTMGELGLFYRLAPIACIGRSFSDDGGGGHNPIEAAQLNCVVLHGPNVQYQEQIFAEMDQAGAALLMKNETEMAATLLRLLSSPQELQDRRQTALAFARGKEAVINKVLAALAPLLEKAGIGGDKAAQKARQA